MRLFDWSPIFYFCALFCATSTDLIDFVTDNLDVNDKGKANVILFLATPFSFDDGAPKNGENVDDKRFVDLGFQKITTVQACPERDPFDAYIEKKSTECDCDDFLKSSLMSLINYSRNARGMTTALASSIKDSFINPKSGIAGNNPKAVHSRNVDKNVLQKDLSTAKVQKELDEMPKIDPIIEPIADDDPFPMFYAVPERTRIHWPKRQGVLLRRQLSLQPEFGGMKPIQVINFERRIKENRPKSLKEVLGLIANIRSAFFNDFFYNEIDPKRQTFDESNGISIKNFADANEPSLPNLVEKTLESAQKEKDNGFLMTVIGGHLKESSDPNSDFLRSIKHVDENTDDKNTLIVVTGMCPKKSQKRIPVYVKGPNSAILSKARILPDVPRLIKDILSNKRSSIEIEKNPQKGFEEETYGDKIINDNKDVKKPDFVPSAERSAKISDEILEEPAEKSPTKRTLVKREAVFDVKNNASGIAILRFLSVLFALVFVF